MWTPSFPEPLVEDAVFSSVCFWPLCQILGVEYRLLRLERTKGNSQDLVQKTLGKIAIGFAVLTLIYWENLHIKITKYVI